MKNLLLTSIYAIAASTASAAIYSTDFSGTTAGALNGQDGWTAQNEWVADGTGNVNSTSGAFIRAQNSTVQYDNTLGAPITITTTFTLGASVVPTNTSPPAFARGVVAIALTDQVAAAAPGVVGGSGLFLNAAGDGFEVRAGGGTAAIIGSDLTNLAGDTFTLTNVYTRTDATTFSVSTSLTNDTDGGTTTTSGTFAGGAALDAATAINGVVQALPIVGASGQDAQRFSGVTLTSYSFEVVPEPSSALLLGLGGLALLRRRRS